MALLLALTFFLQAFFGSRNLSLTWDEPSYIASGYSYLTTYNYRFNPCHPVLMRSLEALPLLFLDIKPAQPTESEILAKHPQAVFGYRFVYGNGNDPYTIARWCRLPVMIAGTALILAIFFWGRELYGDIPALFAAALAAFCPNLIAQSKVASEDIGCTLFVLLSVWMCWKYLESRSNKYVYLCGVLTGLAFLAKLTSLLLLPIYGLLIVAKYLEGGERPSPRDMLLKSCAVFAIAMVIVALAYNGNPLNYFSGVGQLYQDVDDAPMWYFLGEFSPDTRWYYYIVAFFLKTPVPTLLLLLAAVFLAVRNPAARKHAVVLLVPPAVIIIVSCFDKGNFGVRRILPALPFLYLFIAPVVTVDNKIGRVFAWSILAWIIAEAVYIYPHHLSYFNVAVGGPERAPYLLIADDSDTGQDLPALAAWQRNHPEAGTIRLVYEGTANPAAYGVNATRVMFAEIDDPPPGIYAISITALASTPWLRHARPIARAGYSIYIYQF